MKFEQRKDPLWEELDGKIEALAESSEEVKSIIKAINTKGFPYTDFRKMVGDFNTKNFKPFDSWYREKDFEGVNGEKFRIKMDDNGNVELLGGKEWYGKSVIV